MSNLDRKMRAAPAVRAHRESARSPGSNPDLARYLARLNDDARQPKPARADETFPRKEKKKKKGLAPADGRPQRKRVTSENGKLSSEVFNEEKGVFIADPVTTLADDPQMETAPIIKIAPDIVENAKKEHWQREALLARTRGQGGLDAKYSPPPIPAVPPPLRGAEERIESELTGFKQTEADLNATFKKKFISMPLTPEEQEASKAARLAAQKFASRQEPVSVAPQSDMIQRLDAWIRGEKKKAEHEELSQRLGEHFPKLKNLDVTGFVGALSSALEQKGEELVQERREYGLERRHTFVSAWIPERFDAANKMRITKFMVPLWRGIIGMNKVTHAVMSSPKMRYALPVAVFAAALAGVSSALNENADAFSQLHANADTLPTFAPDSLADVQISHPTVAVPVVDNGGSPNMVMLNGDTPNAVVEGPVMEAGEAKPNMPNEAESAPVPYEIKENRSVWSGLLEGLKKDGVDLSKGAMNQFAAAVHQAVEELDLQDDFVEFGGRGLDDVAWNKLPDTAYVHFDKLFGNKEFMDHLSELVTSPKYSVLARELGNFDGPDVFINRVQDAFHVRV